MNFSKGKVFFLVTFLAVFATVFFVNLNHKNTDTLLVSEEQKTNPFDNISLEAKSAYVLDVKTGEVLFAKNEEAQLPLASVTKLMTALVSSEIAPAGILVTINDEDIKTEGDSGFSLGEKWSFKNLLDFTLVTSSNDGACALASVVNYLDSNESFVDKMNDKAKDLGLAQTFYLNESGLDLNTSLSGAYGSAKDMALLMGYIIKNKPEILDATKYSDLKINSKEFVHDAKNTNEVVDVIPGIVASKTGYTDLAGGNLAVAFDLSMGHPMVVVVLGSSVEGRFEDVLKLVDASIGGEYEN